MNDAGACPGHLHADAGKSYLEYAAGLSWKMSM